MPGPVDDYSHMTMDIPGAGRNMTIPAGEFKARCLKLLDVVNQTRVEVTITKRGRPIARLVTLEEEKPPTIHGFLSGHVIHEEDIVGSTGEGWDADRE